MQHPPVQEAVDDLGQHYLDLIELMPGLSSVELVEDGADSVTIRTNEWLMKRTNISKRAAPGSVTVEFDEEYKAGSKVTTKSHFLDEFTSTDKGVTHRLVMSDVEAPGFLGFFYRKFGSNKMGNAFLTAYETYFDSQT